MANCGNVLSLIQPGTVDGSRYGKPIRVLGIDLGTTNSTVSEARWQIAAAELPEVRCLEVAQQTLQGEYTHVLLPSVVAIHEGRVFVGEGAKRMRAQASALNLAQNVNVFIECKNDMGNRRTYHRAPEGFRSAAEIGGKVLKFLHDAAVEDAPEQTDRVVVTVPASFQAAQRHDTVRAAELAGIDLSNGDLLDEPVAAFLDYLVNYGHQFATAFDQPRTVVVFDFGGGTCDVAVFRMHRPEDGQGQFNVAWLAVSRYYRLGGGDIDRAIVYDVLIPQLCEQNGVAPLGLDYEAKKTKIEPALLGVAEMLKIGLCVEIGRLIGFGKYADADKTQIVKTHPGVLHCQLNGQTLTLRSPQLTAARFEELLTPFLEQDLLYTQETEYRMTCSIFAPLTDAMDRAQVDKDAVDFCLAAGGSSLIPQVESALDAFFPHAKLFTYANRDEAKTCVSRGAAYHALSLAACGRGLVQPVCHDEIAIRAESGLVTLIPQGASLPYPGDGSWERCDVLAVPKTTLLEPCELRVEVLAASDERPLLTRIWSIPGPVERGMPLVLEYRLDENQVLAFKARLADSEEDGAFEASIENPLTHVVNPEPKRVQVEQIEEELRTGCVPDEEVSEKLGKVAALYAELGQVEKAIAFLQRAMRARNAPDAHLLNSLAGYYGKMGDVDREEKCYREAARVSPWSGSWFNLSLALKRRSKLDEAAEAIENAITLDPEPPYLVQSALIARARGHADYRESLGKALDAFDLVRALNDWELHWLTVAAEAADDAPRLKEAREQKLERAKGSSMPQVPHGELPILTQSIAKRES